MALKMDSHLNTAWGSSSNRSQSRDQASYRLNGTAPEFTPGPNAFALRQTPLNQSTSYGASGLTLPIHSTGIQPGQTSAYGNAFYHIPQAGLSWEQLAQTHGSKDTGLLMYSSPQPYSSPAEISQQLGSFPEYPNMHATPTPIYRSSIEDRREERNKTARFFHGDVASTDTYAPSPRPRAITSELAKTGPKDHLGLKSPRKRIMNKFGIHQNRILPGETGAELAVADTVAPKAAKVLGARFLPRSIPPDAPSESSASLQRQNSSPTHSTASTKASEGMLDTKSSHARQRSEPKIVAAGKTFVMEQSSRLRALNARLANAASEHSSASLKYNNDTAPPTPRGKMQTGNSQRDTKKGRHEQANETSPQNQNANANHVTFAEQSISPQVGRSGHYDQHPRFEHAANISSWHGAVEEEDREGDLISTSKYKPSTVLPSRPRSVRWSDQGNQKNTQQESDQFLHSQSFSDIEHSPSIYDSNCVMSPVTQFSPDNLYPSPLQTRFPPQDQLLNVPLDRLRDASNSSNMTSATVPFMLDHINGNMDDQVRYELHAAARSGGKSDAVPPTSCDVMHQNLQDAFSSLNNNLVELVSLIDQHNSAIISRFSHVESSIANFKDGISSIGNSMLNVEMMLHAAINPSARAHATWPGGYRDPSSPVRAGPEDNNQQNHSPQVSEIGVSFEPPRELWDAPDPRMHPANRRVLFD